MLRHNTARSRENIAFYIVACNRFLERANSVTIMSRKTNTGTGEMCAIVRLVSK
jgi:hypothetical protein